MEGYSAHIVEMPLWTKASYLVLAHAVALIQNDPLAHHIMFIRWIVVKAIARHSLIL